MRVAGIMSGTSLDGIDVAIVDIRGKRIQPIAFHAVPYPKAVREAILGGTITIPTIEGEVNLKVPAGSQSGQTLKLKGKGAMNPKTKQRGDLMVKLVVKVPKTDDREILEAVRKMDRYYEEDVRKALRF